MKMHKDAMSNIGQPAEPKPHIVECAIVELLDIAQRQALLPLILFNYWTPECKYQISWQR